MKTYTHAPKSLPTPKSAPPPTKEITNHISLISLTINDFNFPMDGKTGSILLMHSRNTPDLQEQTLSQCKELENDISSKLTEKKRGIAILISKNISLRPEIIKGDG